MIELFFLYQISISLSLINTWLTIQIDFINNLIFFSVHIYIYTIYVY